MSKKRKIKKSIYIYINKNYLINLSENDSKAMRAFHIVSLLKVYTNSSMPKNINDLMY